jgi:nucleoside-diphosphate-sugar epimerase
MVMKNVLVVGGSSAEGIHVWDQLVHDGHIVTIAIDKDNIEALKIPGEDPEASTTRRTASKVVMADRRDGATFMSSLQSSGIEIQSLDIVCDVGGQPGDEIGDVTGAVTVAKAADAHLIHTCTLPVGGAGAGSVIVGPPGDSYIQTSGGAASELVVAAAGISKWTVLRVPRAILGTGRPDGPEGYFFSRLSQVTDPPVPAMENDKKAKKKDKTSNKPTPAPRTIFVPKDRRSFVGLLHVKDLAAAVSAVCASPEEAVGQSFTVQGPQSPTLDEFARLCGEAVGLKKEGVKVKLFDPDMFPAFSGGEGAAAQENFAASAFPFAPGSDIRSCLGTTRTLGWVARERDLSAALKMSYEAAPSDGWPVICAARDDAIEQDDRIKVVFMDDVARDSIH